MVSLAPLATRFVVALGGASLLVGVDPESGRVPGAEAVSRVDLAGADDLSPDLVLVRALPAGQQALPVTWGASEAEWIEFAPHDMEDALALCRELGPRLVGETRTRSFENRLTRPLAEVGGSSFGQPRPRVLAVVGLDPVELAGGHSFETDLIEIAGGSSVTHTGGENRIRLTPETWKALAPELVLVMTPEPPPVWEREAALRALPEGTRVAFLTVDASGFWLDDEPAATARRLRAVIEPLSKELGARSSRAER